jgi:4-oxalocrotonate tautomerase family enzyme
MPFVNVKMTPKSQEQVKAMAEGISNVIEQVCHLPPTAIWVTFEEIPENMWGVGGKLLKEGPSERR